jgi:hypothetical protein
MDFPNNRLTYTGIQGPLFDDEIQNALNALYKGMNTILGFGATDFKILSGFVYTAGSPGSYTGGIVYMSGQIYYCAAGLNEGQYLIPNISQIESKPHKDGVNRNTYQVYYAVSSNTSGAGGSPIFSGNMNSYRGDVTSQVTSEATTRATNDTTLQDNINSEATTRATNDSSLANAINIEGARIDALIIKIGLVTYGIAAVGDIDGSGHKDVTVNIGQTLSNSDYIVFGSIHDTTGQGSFWTITAQTTSTFTCRFFASSSGDVQAITFNWAVIIIP